MCDISRAIGLSHLYVGEIRCNVINHCHSRLECTYWRPRSIWREFGKLPESRYFGYARFHVLWVRNSRTAEGFDVVRWFVANHLLNANTGIQKLYRLNITFSMPLRAFFHLLVFSQKTASADFWNGFSRISRERKKIFTYFLRSFMWLYVLQNISENQDLPPYGNFKNLTSICENGFRAFFSASFFRNRSTTTYRTDLSEGSFERSPDHIVHQRGLDFVWFLVRWQSAKNRFLNTPSPENFLC